MGDYVSFKATSWNSNGSSNLLKKRVSTNVNHTTDMMKQYIEMGGLLGYDMEANRESLSKFFQVLVCASW